MAEITIGLFTTEAIGRRSPYVAGALKVIDDVEYATMEWIDWYNNRRLPIQLDYMPPNEHEAT